MHKAARMNAANALNAALALMILYIPYQRHFPVVIEVKGLNLINVMFLIALLIIWWRKPATQLPNVMPLPTPLKWHFSFFIVCLVVSFVIGQFYDSSTFADDITSLKTTVFYLLLYFLFYHAVRDIKTIRLLFGVILFVSAIVSLHAFRQALDYGLAVYNETRRASGPFAPDSAGANYAAAFFVIFTPLFIAILTIYKSHPMLRIISLSCLILSVVATFFTYSRQAYFILAAQFLIHAIRRSLLFGLLILMLILGYEVWLPTSVTDRVQMTEQVDEQGEEKLDESTASRFIIWEGAGKLIAERPWGLGLNHFKREIGRYVPEYSGYDAHNAYVLITTELGVVGLFSLLLLIFGLLRLAQKVKRLDKSEDTQVLGEAFLLSVIGLILCNFFGSRIFDGLITGNFWILTALVSRYYTLELERQTTVTKGTNLFVFAGASS